MENTSTIPGVDLKASMLKGFKNLFLRHISGFAVNFAGGLILARVLGPETFGLFFIAFTILIIFRGIIDFGIQTHFIRQEHVPTQEEIKTAFTFQQILAVICLLLSVVAGYAAVEWYHKPVQLFYLILSVGIGAFFYIFQSIPTALLERTLEYKKVGIIEVGELIAFNLAAVVLVLLGWGVWGLVLGNICRGLVPAVLAMKYSGFKPGLLVDRKLIKELFNSVSKVFYINMSTYLTVLAPVVLLAGQTGLKDYGISQLAYTILNYTTVIPTIFKRIGLTAFARVQDKKDKFNKLTQNLLLLLSISYIPLVVCIASFSSLWIPAVYGKDWLEMGGVLKLAAIPVCGIALLSIFYSALMSVEKYDIVLKQNILHGAVYWIAMAFLVKPLGALSVPATHIIAMLASSYLFVYGYNKYCGKIKYLYVSVFFSVNILMLAATHLLLKHNLPVAAVGLWVLFIVFIGVGIKKQVMPMIAEQR